MSTREKRPISVRLPADLVAWAEEYGRARRWDRSTVIVAALEALRGDAAGGVPELGEAVESRRAPGPVSKEPSENPDAPLSPRASVSKPERTSFESGEEWQDAMRLWKARRGL